MYNDSGSSTTTTTTHADMIGNVYCIVSAMFFAACAYAQLNDPAPALWVAAYLGGGTIPNLLLTSCPPKTTLPVPAMNLALTAFAGLMALAVLAKMVAVAPKLLEEFGRDNDHPDNATQASSPTVRAVAWAFLEHEEGRDSGGLVLLIAHVLYLKNNYLHQGGGGRRQRSGGGGGGKAARRISPAVFSVTLITVLVGAIYMWLVHHPHMVAKYKLPHCQGEMFGRDGIEL